jgi:hypothetical protein
MKFFTHSTEMLEQKLKIHHDSLFSLCFCVHYSMLLILFGAICTYDFELLAKSLSNQRYKRKQLNNNMSTYM